MELPFRGGGGSGRDEPELERCGGAGACEGLGEGFGPFFLDMLPTSTDCERFKGSCLMDGSSLAGSVVVPNPQCWANSE
jgi:hypothetical protein